MSEDVRSPCPRGQRTWTAAFTDNASIRSWGCQDLSIPTWHEMFPPHSPAAVRARRMKQREGAKALSRPDQLKRLAVHAREDPDVLAVLLFGSAGRGEVPPASDVDVCLVLQPQAGERTS